MPEIVVTAESRTDTGKNANRRLRAADKIPGILYGTGKEPTPVAVSPHSIGAILRSAAGENTLFDHELGGQKRKVIDMDDQYLLGFNSQVGKALMDLVNKMHPEYS